MAPLLRVGSARRSFVELLLTYTQDNTHIKCVSNLELDAKILKEDLNAPVCPVYSAADYDTLRPWLPSGSA